MMERLNQVNGIPVRPVRLKEFETYGRIITGCFSDLIFHMEQIRHPENGNIYLPSVPGMEEAPVTARLRDGFGGMDIQVGILQQQEHTTTD